MRITFEDTPRLAHVSEDGMRNQSILSHLEGTAVIAERFAKSLEDRNRHEQRDCYTILANIAMDFKND